MNNSSEAINDLEGQKWESQYEQFQMEPHQALIQSQHQCTRILNESRQTLEDFIDLIGQIKYSSLKLALYESDFELALLEQTITLEDINQLVESSIRKMKVNKKIKCNWSREDLLILLWVIQKYSQYYNKAPQQYDSSDWDRVGSMVPGKNGRQSMFKWLSLKSNKCVDKKAWQDWQDKFLRQSVSEKDERQWLKISQELYLQKQNTSKVYRTAKQCRERWSCFVNPVVKKGSWQKEEDYILISKYLEIGKRWSIITKLLEGRTENAVKNRWKLIVNRRKFLCKRSQTTVEQFLTSYLMSLQVNNICYPEKVLVSSSTQLPEFQTRDKLETFLGKPIETEGFEQYLNLDDDLIFISKENPQKSKLQTRQIDFFLQDDIGKVQQYKNVMTYNMI